MRTVNVTQLPDCTKKLVLAKQVLDTAANRQDGFTQGLSLRDTPEEGYMVGTGMGEFNAKGMTFEQIKGKVNQIFNTYPQEMYLGAWNHKDSTIVEVSKLVLDKTLALEIASLDNQFSIWDLKNKKEIVVQYELKN